MFFTQFEVVDNLYARWRFTSTREKPSELAYRYKKYRNRNYLTDKTITGSVKNMAKLIERILASSSLLKLERSWHIYSVRNLNGKKPEEAKSLKQKLEGKNINSPVSKM